MPPFGAKAVLQHARENVAYRATAVVAAMAQTSAEALLKSFSQRGCIPNGPTARRTVLQLKVCSITWVKLPAFAIAVWTGGLPAISAAAGVVTAYWVAAEIAIHGGGLAAICALDIPPLGLNERAHFLNPVRFITSINGAPTSPTTHPRHSAVGS